MKRRRHTPEQIIRKLREADRLLGEGREVTTEVAKQLEVSSEATYHRWRAEYGGLKADDVKRLKLHPGHDQQRLKERRRGFRLTSIPGSPFWPDHLGAAKALNAS